MANSVNRGQTTRKNEVYTHILSKHRSIVSERKFEAQLTTKVDSSTDRKKKKRK